MLEKFNISLAFEQLFFRRLIIKILSLNLVKHKKILEAFIIDVLT